MSGVGAYAMEAITTIAAVSERVKDQMFRVMA
jgi:hypothetical protein